MNRELLPTSGIRARLSAITPACQTFVLPYLFQAARLPAHRQSTPARIHYVRLFSAQMFELACFQ